MGGEKQVEGTKASSIKPKPIVLAQKKVLSVLCDVFSKGYTMIWTVFLIGFLFSSCWAANENKADEEIPFLTSSQGNSNDEIPFLTSSQGNSHDEIPFLTSSQGNSNDEIPFLTSSQGNSDGQKVSNLLPAGIVEPDVPPTLGVQSTDNRGRSDIEIEDDQPSGGYFYPKPSKPFNLPQFKTLDASAPLNAAANFAEENTEAERLPRSPRRRPPYFPGYQPPPPFIPGFIPPHNIRPLPALYGRY